jgi:hypothetical protein
MSAKIVSAKRALASFARPLNHCHLSVRCFSTRPPAPRRPGFQIPAQGFVFTVLLFPAMAYTLYAGRYGPSEDELEREIRQRYSGQIAENREKNEAMAELFQHAIHKPDGKMDENLKEVLYAGKGGKKRLFAVDDKLYGTSEGVAERARRDDERVKRKEYRRKKKAGEIVEEKSKGKQKGSAKTAAEEAPGAPPRTKSTAMASPGLVNVQSAATIAVVAIAAAGAGYLAGGSRRS